MGDTSWRSIDGETAADGRTMPTLRLQKIMRSKLTSEHSLLSIDDLDRPYETYNIGADWPNSLIKPRFAWALAVRIHDPSAFEHDMYLYQVPNVDAGWLVFNVLTKTIFHVVQAFEATFENLNDTDRLFQYCNSDQKCVHRRWGNKITKCTPRWQQNVQFDDNMKCFNNITMTTKCTTRQQLNAQLDDSIKCFNYITVKPRRADDIFFSRQISVIPRPTFGALWDSPLRGRV